MRRSRVGGGVKTRKKRQRTNRPVTSQRIRDALRFIENEYSRRRGVRHTRRMPARDYSPPSPPSPPTPLSPPSPGTPEPDMSHLSIVRTLPQDAVPAPEAIDYNTSNFYITPKEVIEVLDRYEDELFDNERLKLNAMRNFISARENKNAGFEDFFSGRRTEPTFDMEKFITNELRKMHAGEHVTRQEGWMFPHLVGSTEDTLSIPSQDVYDLPVYLMLYILRRLTQFPRGRSSFTVGYQLGTKDDRTIYPISRDDGSPVTVVDGLIHQNDLNHIYMRIIRQFASLLPDNEGNSTWNGSEDSGTRVLLRGYNKSHRLYLKLVFTPTPVVFRAHGWTQEVEDLLNQTVCDSVISVRNTNDNKCLLYCLVIGIIMKFKESGGRVFNDGSHGLVKMIPPETVYAKAMYMYQDDDEMTDLLHRLGRLLMPPVYSHGPPDPLVKFVENLDKKAGTMLSITEFRKEFGEIEATLIPNNLLGIDVYGIDFNINRHIYPLYMSKNRERVLELLCVTPPRGECSHYCLVVNMEKLLRGSGGKQFFSCSRCGQCFYHRRLLKDHKCPAQVDHFQVNGEGGYHYSKKGVDPNTAVICGSCSKCRLCFTDDFSAEYEKENCLMKGLSGYRHVQLMTYKPEEHPTLDGAEIDNEAEANHVKRRRVMYADFECSINPETGAHEFMSYGIYDWKLGIYKCGYSLQEFIDFILEVAYGHDEDQIYVYFHNAMGYDANFILRHVLKTPEYRSWGIQVIMKSMNRLQKLVFHTHIEDKSRAIHIGDTFLFLTLSLEKIVGSIRKDDIAMNKQNFDRFFEIFRRRYPDVPDEEIDHILRKNIFPYKFFTSSEKLDTPINEFRAIFEPKEENLRFFSERVTLSDLEKSYADTCHVIETFHCKDARDYHDLYLCCDVMQLADVFDRSMNILWESHHIHLTRYLGMPSASWAAFLRHDPTMTIPLYEDVFYPQFFKGMTRGGITSAALRYAKASDKYSIIYLDVNGLYPYVMQKFEFPCGRFEFVGMGYTGNLCRIKLYELFEKCEREHIGMCFCVDMHFPEAVKEMTDMYPFAPEHRRIFREYFMDPDQKNMTPFLKKWSEANGGETMKEFTGLVCTLYDKKKYNVHWRLLKFYMDHGVEITKVWFGVKFDEGDYLRGYIRKNIEIRNMRADELGKVLYKLLGNSIYGKTYESPFKRNTFEIITDPVKMQGLLEEGNIAAMRPIDELGWIVRMDGEDIILDKPTYIGACVCEFSKLHMYELLYDKLVPMFAEFADPGEKGCELVYTDTDSFIVKVRNPPEVEAAHGDPKMLFDFMKKKDPELIGGIGGQVKSETGEDDTIDEIYALRSKVYAYKTRNGHIGKRAKGTTHDAQEMQLDFETYKRAYESLVSIDTRNVQFVREVFSVTSLDVYRRSLSVNDGKRDICEDGTHTHAFGYRSPN